MKVRNSKTNRFRELANTPDSNTSHVTIQIIKNGDIVCGLTMDVDHAQELLSHLYLTEESE